MKAEPNIPQADALRADFLLDHRGAVSIERDAMTGLVAMTVAPGATVYLDLQQAQAVALALLRLGRMPSAMAIRAHQAAQAERYAAHRAYATGKGGDE